MKVRLAVAASLLSGMLGLAQPAFPQVAAHATLTWTGPDTCLPCHQNEARQVHASSHYQWNGPAPESVGGPLLQGKIRTALNSYCINILGNWSGCGNCHIGLGAVPAETADAAQLANIDCLICHQEGYRRKKVNGVFVPDTAAMTITMDEAARTVQRPTRAACLQCHARGGGGDNYKRGDIALAHAATSDRSFDVHMAISGGNLSCQQCHAVARHHIAGRGSDLRQTDGDVRPTCSTAACHPTKASGGHTSAALNRHMARVACQTCHVGAVSARRAADTAATEATEMHRDWSKPHPTASGAIHPLPTLANDIKPEYRFWNGYSRNYSLGERLEPDSSSGRYTTSRPLGAVTDLSSKTKLFPFKYKTALQPMATSHGILVPVDTSVFFATGDLASATAAGLRNLGLSANEPWSMVTSDTYQLLTHEIAPAVSALGCAQCHGASATQMSLKALGHQLKGPESSVCTQCHEQEDDDLDWREVHDKHVTDKRYDCSHCHTFSRPERKLRGAAVAPLDTDGDGLPDDGDGSGISGDRPCQAGEQTQCDDPDRDGDGLPDAWETQFGLLASSSQGDNGVIGDADGDFFGNGWEHARGTHPRGTPAGYFAEGATGFFRQRLALFNPGMQPAVVNLRFLAPSGTPSTSVVPVPAHSRRTVDVETLPGMASSEFSTEVESDVPIVSDRTMTWSGKDAYGAHAETAVPAPALTWYLAEGATHGTFNLFYLLQNPNAAQATVRVRYLRPAGEPLDKTYVLPPNSRTNIWVDVEQFPEGSGNLALADTDVSAVFEVLDGRPVIVERAMYADVPGQTFGAGHESAGITTAGMEWFLAEGATGPYFDLFVLVANPSATASEIDATFLLPDGSTVVKQYTVAPNSRFNIWVDHADAQLANTAVSTTIRSTNGVPVIVERAMWWPDGNWHEAHNSPGATATGTKWAVAEGEVDATRNLETYILVANTSDFPADVRVSLYFEDGSSREGTFLDISPRSRFNVPIGLYFPDAIERRFGAVVESVGAAPASIVVERAMYWDAAGQRWAAGTNALATKLQ